MTINLLKILMLEVVAEEAELIQRKLKNDVIPCEFKVVVTEDDYIRELEEFQPHLILSDYEMLQFSAIEALQILKKRSIDIPFILVTGNVSEEFAAAITKAGADDYLLKDRLVRLPAAIEAALRLKQIEREKCEALQKIVQNEKRFRAMVENNEGIFSLIDEQLFTIFRSSSSARITGWTNEEFEKIDSKQFTHPDDIEKVQSILAEALANPGKPFIIKLRVRHKNGHYIFLEGFITNQLNDPDIKGIVTNLRDITNSVIAEQKLIKANRLYLFISQINQMIVRTTDEQTLFKEACKIAVELGKFKMAWIGMIDKITNEIIPVMHEGQEYGYLSKAITVDNVPVERWCLGDGINVERYIVCNDIEHDPQMTIWKDAAIARGYFSSISIPIKKFGKVIGAFTLYAIEKNFFDAEEIALLEEATNDISFALEIFEKERLRKNAEESILESEYRYHTLTEISPVGIFHTDSLGNVNYVNPCWCKISGISFQDALGNGWQQGVHVDDRKLLTKSWLHSTGIDRIALSEYRFARSDGSIAWVLGQAIAETNSKNQVIGFVGTITDITENKKAVDLIRREKLLNDTIISNLPGIFYLYDFDGNFIRWNKNFEEVTGFNSQEISNMHPLDFYDTDQKEKINALIKSVIEKLTTGVEVEIFTKNKNKIPYYINSVAIEYQGKQCKLGMGVNLSERKIAENEIKKANERYNIVAKATNDSIWELNIITGEIIRTGDGFKILFGYDEEEEINTDSNYAKLVHPDDFNYTKESMLAVFKNPDAYYWGGEYRFLKRNGQYAYVHDRGYIIRDKNGTATRMIGATQDITKLKENEINLKKLNENLLLQAKELADSNAELEQFAYVASHDLQEPLRMITGFLSLLEKNYGTSIDENGKKYIHFAVDGAKRMKQIIFDILEFSKVGRMDGTKKQVNLQSVVNEIKLLYRKSIKEKMAIITVSKLPVLFAYEAILRQVFQNIIGNALKYTKSDTPPQIKITATEQKGFWLFSVKDNGIGIEKEYFDRIFIIFQRLHNQNQFSGTGIGLAITKKIIENLGGKIWLESEPGKGSTFYFTIKK